MPLIELDWTMGGDILEIFRRQWLSSGMWTWTSPALYMGMDGHMGSTGWLISSSHWLHGAVVQPNLRHYHQWTLSCNYFAQQSTEGAEVFGQVINAMKNYNVLHYQYAQCAWLCMYAWSANQELTLVNAYLLLPLACTTSSPCRIAPSQLAGIPPMVRWL